MADYKSQYTGEQIDHAIGVVFEMEASSGDDGGVTYEGTCVAFSAEPDVEITVKAADGSKDELTFVHAGKNLFKPFTAEITSNGVTVTPLADGKMQIVGTASTTTWLNTIKKENAVLLPAGDYTLTTNLPYLTASCTVTTPDGSLNRNAHSELVRKFTLAEPTLIYTIVTLNANKPLDGTFWIQLERNAEKSVYEPYKSQDYSGSPPVIFNAYKDVNMVYSTDGKVLSVTLKASDETVIKEAVSAELARIDGEQNYNLPVLELTGNTGAMTKEVAVDLDYKWGEMTGTCSVKWQGSSSLAWPKKNYTIKFDQEFEAVEGWGAQKKYCLKANYIDFSHSRNLVNAKLWGQIVKSRDVVPTQFANLVNGGAVDGFPIVIKLNGEFHGVYTWNIPKDGWMMGMGSGTQECILCADAWEDPTGFKSPAVIDDHFSLEYVSDENNTAWVTTSLNRLINACINSNGSDIDTTIAQYVDLQSAIDYYIFAVLLAGGDMTQKNYILATYDGIKWYFSAYDMDCTHGLEWDGMAWQRANSAPSFTGYASAHRLMELIKNYKKDELKARYAELRSDILSESNIARTFGNFAGLIPVHALVKDVQKWPTIPNTSVNNVSQIRDYYRMRCAYADEWMEAL